MADVTLPRTLRRAVMRIETETGISELHHVGAPDQHEARAPQPGHHRRVCGCGRSIAQRQRARARHLALDVEQVLDRNRDPGEARRCRIGLAQLVHRFRGSDCALAIDMNECTLAFAALVVDPCKAFVNQRAGAGAPRIEISGERVQCSGIRHHLFRFQLRTRSSQGFRPPSSSGAMSISRSSNAELSALPCASSASERVTPPPSVWSITKFNAEIFGSS